MNSDSGACCFRNLTLFGSMSGKPDVCVSRWISRVFFLAMSAEVRQVASDEMIELYLALLDQHHDGCRDKGFRGRCNQEDCVVRHFSRIVGTQLADRESV